MGRPIDPIGHGSGIEVIWRQGVKDLLADGWIEFSFGQPNLELLLMLENHRHSLMDRG